jgi:hypothetical protein
MNKKLLEISKKKTTLRGVEFFIYFLTQEERRLEHTHPRHPT